MHIRYQLSRKPIALLLSISLILIGVSPLNSGVSGLIERLRVSHDTRAAFHLESFGYEEGGVFQLNIHDWEVSSDTGQRMRDSDSSEWKSVCLAPDTLLRVPEGTQTKDNYEIAFMLQRSDSDSPARLSSSASTADSADTQLSSHLTHVSTDPANPDVSLISFKILDNCFHTTQYHDEDLIIRYGTKHDWKKNATVLQTVIQQPGFYHLYFSNCEPMSSVSWQIEFIEYNTNVDGSPMFLNAGERFLPTIYLILAFSFLFEFVGWGISLQRNSANVKSIHYLMLAAVFIKMVSVGLESMKYHSLKAKGIHDGWFIAWYIASIIKSMFLFVVIVLLATGWSYLKPFLTERDRYLLFATLVVQALVNVCVVVVGELQQGDPSWSTVHDILAVLDMVCWCLILVPIVWSIRSLRTIATDERNKDEAGSAGRNMHRLRAFRSFYLLVIGFIYFTRIVVFLLSLTLPFESVWISTIFAESATLIFYASTGFLFRPISRNPYHPLEGLDEEEEFGLNEDEDEEDEEVGEIELSHHPKPLPPPNATNTSRQV